MKKKLLELKRKLEDKKKELRALLDVAVGEDRGLTDEEKKKAGGLKELCRTLEDSVTETEEAVKEEERAAKDAEEAKRNSEGPEGAEGRQQGEEEIRVGSDRWVERGFESFGEQLLAIRNAGAQGAIPDKRLLHVNAAELRATGAGESVPSEGGFLVQKDFSGELLKKMYEIGQILSRVRRIPVSGNGIKINAIDETSRADGSRLGGVRGFWLNEAAAFTASKPKFRQLDMPLEKLGALFYATDELLEDTTALGALAAEVFPEEMRFKAEDAIINGDGSGKPLGILKGGQAVSVAKETGQVANTVVYENIVKMWSRCWARGRVNAVWLINQDVEPELFNLGITVGTGGTPAYLPAGGLSGSPFSTLLGRPVIAVEYCATVGTVGDIILTDLGSYLLIDKGGIKQAMSIHVRFLFDESTFRFIYRVNGQPTWDKALTPFKGTNTLSPDVTLATRA